MKRTPLLIAAVIFGTTAFAGQQPGGHFLEIWDQDSDGHVTLAEATERRSDIFASFDDNDDGFLSAKDYATFDEARAADQKNHKQGIGQGKRKGMGIRKGQSGQAGMKMDFNDINNDGKVSFEEFTSRTAAWFSMLDKNGDGVVATDDFGRKN